MKLSEISTDHVLDVLATAAIELEPVFNDDDLMEKLHRDSNLELFSISNSEKLLAEKALTEEGLTDDEKNELKTLKQQKGVIMRKASKKGMNMLVAGVLAVSKTYRKNLYNILAAFAQTTVEEIGKKPLLENIRQIQDCLNDEVFLSFFPQLRSWVQTE